MAGSLRTTVLIGREPELATVRQALLDARGGAGRVLVVSGQAGVGKSRLLDEAVRVAGGLHMTVLRGRAVPEGGPLRPVAEAFYGHLRRSAVTGSAELRPFRAALERLLPGRADAATSPGVDPLVVLGEGLLLLLRRAGGEHGCLLVLDDLHWADRDTLGLLDYLATAVADVPVAVVLSARDDEGGPELLPRLRHLPELIRVVLRRLTPDEVGRLAAACAGGQPLPARVLDFLASTADGLPFLVGELLDGLVESGSLVDDGGWQVRGELTAQVPQTLAELVRHRTAGFAPEHLRVLQAAAVLGRSVDWSLLAPIAGVGEEAVALALRAAVEAHLLQPEAARPGQFGWRHELIREAVLAGLLVPGHALLARRAAQVMEQRDPDPAGPDGALIAELHARAGRPHRAAKLLVRVARQALARGAVRTAEAVLARAADLGGGTAVDVELVRVLTTAGRGARALAVGEAALPATGGEARVELCLHLARAAIMMARWQAARDYLDRAGRPDDPRVAALAADAAFGAGRVAEAAELAGRAFDAAERAGSAAVACEALEVVGRCARMSDPAAASAAFRRAADLAEAHGLVPWRIRALLGLGFVELLATETSAHAHQARRLADEAGMIAEVAGIDMVLANCRGLVEGPAAALPLAERAERMAATLRLPQVQAKARLFVALAHAAAGRTDAMNAALAEAQRLDPGAPDVVGAAAGVAAVAALYERDRGAARDLLDRSVAAMRGHPAAAPVHDWGLWALVRAALADRDRAARDELRGSGLTARAVNLGALHYADAIAAGRAGRRHEAAALLAAGDEALATQHWWRRFTRLIVLECALDDGWGEPVKELRAALDAFESAGERRPARMCRDLLRRAGAPVPRRGRGAGRVPPRLRAAGVTSREVDVLDLVVRGLTNAQIAERLFLSPRTVETHVSHLLAKTGAADRAALAAHWSAQTP
ncbi:ATP-binding protein [Actinoplanes sp. URMC 104]|uniref:ATP-binding protein n=1 Tax=Actinoplanes sp. URMC 104 TaxID=3423409 RepID=UPI003F1C9C47